MVPTPLPPLPTRKSLAETPTLNPSMGRLPQLATFTAPTPLTRQITAALKVLRTARFDNDETAICIAERRLDRLLDRYPR